MRAESLTIQSQTLSTLEFFHISTFGVTVEYFVREFRVHISRLLSSVNFCCPGTFSSQPQVI